MGWWERIFGSATPSSPVGDKKYREKDNKGTRQETTAQATAYWMARNVQQKFDPFALYTFDRKEDAKKALLQLDCMQIAEDSGEVICTETLIFGYYETEEGKCEAIVCGDDLTVEVWEEARTSFQDHGGSRKNEQKPEKSQPGKTPHNQGNSNRVKYLREDRQERMGHTMVYRVHKGPDAASAKAFLQQNPVSKPLYYLVVETPDGNYCRDKDGIYKE